MIFGKNVVLMISLAVLLKYSFVFGSGSLNYNIVHQEGSYELVCQKEGVLKEVLEKVTDTKQFVSGDTGQTISLNLMFKGKCGFVQTSPRELLLKSFYKTDNNLIFPIFIIPGNGVDGQGMFLTKDPLANEYWTTSFLCGQSLDELLVPCIVPRRCDAVNDLVGMYGKQIPAYIKIPQRCRPYRNDLK